MKKTENQHLGSTIIVWTLWILAFAWLAVCFGLSSQTGEETGQLSGSITRFFAEILHLPDSAIPVLNRSLRTLAHIVCFFVLSGLMSGAASVTFPTYAHAFIWPLVPCVLFAFLDEFRKANIPGRHCSIPEACLNAVGCALGCILVGIILWTLRRKI